MDRTEMRRLIGRRLVPRRYWGPADEDSGIEDEVIIDGACPPSPMALAEPAPPPAPTRTRAVRAPRLQRRRHPDTEAGRRGPEERRRERARHIASLYALGGAVIGLAPIPNPDMPLLVTVESRLVADITRLYDQEWAQRAVARAMPLIGFSGYLLRGLSRRGQRRLPMLGWAINGVIAYAGVRLIGEAALRWCEARQRSD